MSVSGSRPASPNDGFVKIENPTEEISSNKSWFGWLWGAPTTKANAVVQRTLEEQRDRGNKQSNSILPRQGTDSGRGSFVEATNYVRGEVESPLDLVLADQRSSSERGSFIEATDYIGRDSGKSLNRRRVEDDSVIESIRKLFLSPQEPIENRSARDNSRKEGIGITCFPKIDNLESTNPTALIGKVFADHSELRTTIDSERKAILERRIEYTKQKSLKYIQNLTREQVSEYLKASPFKETELTAEGYDLMYALLGEFSKKAEFKHYKALKKEFKIPMIVIKEKDSKYLEKILTLIPGTGIICFDGGYPPDFSLMPGSYPDIKEIRITNQSGFNNYSVSQAFPNLTSITVDGQPHSVIRKKNKH